MFVHYNNTHPFYSPLDFVWDYPGKPVPEPIWILLKKHGTKKTDMLKRNGEQA